ncbi:MAG TPA: dienelactone hydrolase family protein [Usitatibacter sp.]|nr:dienelactone hydrolase family protein [Usitatibacter sp.]
MKRAGWILLAGAAACASAPLPAHDEIPIEVLRPGGPGRKPAVVLLHDCSGLGPRSSGGARRWAKVLLEEGYVVLIPDSFSPRGFAGGVCTEASPRRQEVGPLRRVDDALAALRHARSLPFVEAERIAVMGASHGGASTLATLASPKAVKAREAFRAGIALYPSCSGRASYRPHAPLLILTGELDDWTPAEPCRRLADGARAAGHDVTIKVYPGAHHSFDNNAPVRYRAERMNRNAPAGRGATTGGNAEAWADSIREVKAFLARHLRS